MLQHKQEQCPLCKVQPTDLLKEDGQYLAIFGEAKVYWDMKRAAEETALTNSNSSSLFFKKKKMNGKCGA